MKVINLFLLILLFILNSGNAKSVDVCLVKPPTSKEYTCNQPKLHVLAQYYSFKSVIISPHLAPIIESDTFYYLLKDGIEYTLTVQNKGCNVNVTEKFQSTGMYYELITQPKCTNTWFEMKLNNYYTNGTSKIVSGSPGNYDLQNEDQSCTTSFLIIPQSQGKGLLQNSAIKAIPTTCGFNNGSIVVDLTKGYSNVHLFSSDKEAGKEIQPTTEGSFKNLYGDNFILYVDSQECGTERIYIELGQVLPILNVEIKNVPNLFDSSTFSFSLSSGQKGILNSTNSYVFVDNDDNYVISNWTDYEHRFGHSFNYGYYYSEDFQDNNGKSCSTYEKMEADIPVSVLNYTITKHGDSCLNDLLFTVYPFSSNPIYLYDFQADSNIELENNQAIIAYNRDFSLNEKYAGPDQYFSTFYKVPSYSVVETTKGGLTGCWRTFNITINDSGLIDLEFLLNNNERINPDNDVFRDIPSGVHTIRYLAGDCETASFFTIQLGEDECSKDLVSIEYTIIKNATCSTPYEIQFYASTPFGIQSNNFTVSPNSYFSETYAIPKSSAYFDLLYYPPNYLVWDDKDFNITIENNAKCNFTRGSVQLMIPNDPNNPNPQYQIRNVYGNDGVLLQSSGQGTSYFVPPGENLITIQYTYGGSQSSNYCYKSNSVYIDVEFSLKPNYIVSGVTNCKIPDGKISVLNYQSFDTITLELENQTLITAVEGEFTDLYPGSYSVFFESQACNGFVYIIVPTSEDNVEITTSILQNPTCVLINADYADGQIQVNVKKNGMDLENLLVSSLNNSFSDNNVYYGAKVGSNLLKIKSDNCIWYRDINVEKIDDPKFSFDIVFNKTCGWSNVYKLNIGNPNVSIKKFTFTSNNLKYSQGDYYLTFPEGRSFFYSLEWNSVCSNTITMPIKDYNYEIPPVQYEIVKADNCFSLSIDIIITNWNEYSLMRIFNRNPTPINSTHAIFKDLPPSQNYYIYYLYSKTSCDNSEIIGEFELSSGLTKESLNIKKSNDLCHSNIGSIEIQSLDTENYYYSMQKQISLMNSGYDPTTQIATNDQLSNLPSGYYSITRICKSILNCFIREMVEIKSDNPSIQSIISKDSYDTLNNGTVVIKLNYNTSNPVTYEIIADNKLSNNNGIFTNLSPKLYQIKVIITDKMCPVTLSANFTIKSIPAPKDPSSDELSISTFLQINHLLLFIILILSIII
ncbi:hypothetical protein ACTFIV_007781 [Dictyostelium citrinum]